MRPKQKFYKKQKPTYNKNMNKLSVLFSGKAFKKSVSVICLAFSLCFTLYAQAEDSIFSIEQAGTNDFITVVLEPNKAAVKKCVADSLEVIRQINKKKLEVLKGTAQTKQDINTNAKNIKEENDRKVREILGIKDPAPAKNTEPDKANSTSSSTSSTNAAGSKSAEAAAIEKENQTLSKREKLISYCLDNCAGYPYYHGGTTPEPGFDCSGLVQYAARNSIGLKLPRTAREMYKVSQKIEKEEAIPGDLVFFVANNRISHVGIYLGKDTTNDSFKGKEIFFNSASEPKRRSGTIISSLSEPYWRRHFYAFGRVINE